MARRCVNLLSALREGGDVDLKEVESLLEEFKKKLDPPRTPTRRDTLQCSVCKELIFPQNSVPRFWDYMVEDRVWFEEAGFKSNEMACLPCLEYHLERPLELKDFTNAPCNNVIRYMLYRQRYGRTETILNMGSAYLRTTTKEAKEIYKP